MKIIPIFLPADNISLTASDGVTLITYFGVYENRPKMYSYVVIGEFTQFEQNGNLLTLK